MQVIPVIDLRHGAAVHAIAGDRDNYQPVMLGVIRDGDPCGLASFYAARNPPAIYLADLDAILGGEVQASLWHAIAKVTACPLWVDFGARGDLHLPPFLELQHHGESKSCLVLGSETLQDISQIRKIANQISPEQLILRLERKEGKPRSGRRWKRPVAGTA
jgi:phosphoribosylformimino-5-aminoimidazole carboxamide ribotide isomerase